MTPDDPATIVAGTVECHDDPGIGERGRKPPQDATRHALRRQERRSARSRNRRAWRCGHGSVSTVGEIRRSMTVRVMPRMQEMTVPQLMKLTGLSRFHCWKVRKREIAGCTHVIGRRSVLGSVVVP
jgi:hypothetical protein